MTDKFYKGAIDVLMLRLELAESEEDQGKILRQCCNLVGEAAKRGDIEFFNMLADNLPRSK